MVCRGIAVLLSLAALRLAQGNVWYKPQALYGFPSYEVNPYAFGVDPNILEYLQRYIADYTVAQQMVKVPLSAAEAEAVSVQAEPTEASVGSIVAALASNTAPDVVAAAAEVLAENQTPKPMTNVMMPPTVVASGDVVTLPTGELFMPVMLQVPLLIEMPNVSRAIGDLLLGIDDPTVAPITTNNQVDFNVPVIATDIDGSVVVAPGLNFEPFTLTTSANGLDF